jgi:hypothetical protein
VGVGAREGGDGRGVIAPGFFWKDVPELEGVLRRYMEEYYEMRCVDLAMVSMRARSGGRLAAPS